MVSSIRAHVSIRTIMWSAMVSSIHSKTAQRRAKRKFMWLWMDPGYGLFLANWCFWTTELSREKYKERDLLRWQYHLSFYGAYMNMRTYANGHICSFILSKFCSHFYTGHDCNSILGNTLSRFYILHILISQEIKMQI